METVVASSFRGFYVVDLGGIVVWQWGQSDGNIYDRLSPAVLQKTAAPSGVRSSLDQVFAVRSSSHFGVCELTEALSSFTRLDAQTIKEILEWIVNEFMQRQESFDLRPGWWYDFSRARREALAAQSAAEKESRIAPKAPPSKWWWTILTGLLPGHRYQSMADMLDEVGERLAGKNVAVDAAAAVCEAVRKEFELERLELNQRNLRRTFEKVLTQVLLPTRRRPIFQEVQSSKDARRVYSIAVMGVNGVGKSTSLAKLAKHLKDRTGCSIMVAACDTFRSGAVEQLKLHSDRLGLELFQQGYGKEPAAVAQAALKDAVARGIDVVLIDTAGRMQDNAPLMQALGKLVGQTQPDLLLFVGEAAVGNDGLDQLMKFDQALKSGTAATGNVRSVDGILLTKLDTVDDKIGAAISIAYQSQKPILFVGTGQAYEDLGLLQAHDAAITLLN